MIVLGDFSLVRDKPCGWAAWPSDQNSSRPWVWEAFFSERHLSGSGLNKTRAITAAQQAVANLKQVKT